MISSGGLRFEDSRWDVREREVDAPAAESFRPHAPRGAHLALRPPDTTFSLLKPGAPFNRKKRSGRPRLLLCVRLKRDSGRPDTCPSLFRSSVPFERELNEEAGVAPGE